ncbi:MAG: hypothetical protein EYC70_01560 [Planctomycetota bacterium]|nr:MAG: hypothetical protein EYC70_01560 [Planctomycetota bacterium]
MLSAMSWNLHLRRGLGVCAGLLLLAVTALPAQEHEELGRMWTFDQVPAQYLQEEYGFVPSPEWLEHARRSALRFGGGCSAAFVSPRGLILTNHHCARDYVAQLSPPGQDWLGNGYFAAGMAQEVAAPGLTVQQLVAIEDVTAALDAGVTPDLDGMAVEGLRERNRQALLEQTRAEHPGLEPRIVSLYQGGLQHLYLYKVYSDVRLVGAPHLQSAKFGGDFDNFTYPRYALDFALCRAYEDGKPADTSAHYLKWNTAGPRAGDAVFVVGSPGNTGRLMSLAQMEYLRDVEFPSRLEGLHAMLEQLYAEGRDDPQRAADTRARVLTLENARKAFQGYLDGLRNPAILERKRAAEEAIRAKVAADPELSARYGDAWDRIAELVAEKKKAAAAGDSARVQELRAQEQAQARRVGEAFFAVYGTQIPPDASGSLRLSDGVVQGFEYNGTIAPWFTSLFGLYARWTEFGRQEPFNLPQPWIDKLPELDLATPVNFVSSCDIIGGNSGSPVLNRDGELVGLVFDGNIEMLGNMYVYTDEVARSVSVHPAIIIEAMRKVYGADALADELEGRSAGYAE